MVKHNITNVIFTYFIYFSTKNTLYFQNYFVNSNIVPITELPHQSSVISSFILGARGICINKYPINNLVCCYSTMVETIELEPFVK